MKKLLLATLITAPVLFNYTYAAESHKATDDHAITVESKLSAEQKAVYEVVSRYQDALNAGDVDTILSLYSAKSYSQWNNKTTAETTEKRRQQYSDLFKNEKFVTEFAYDSVVVNGDMAFVRTHHHPGAAVTVFKDGSKVLDYNREVFVLEKKNGDWKIVLYTFNTNPVQGES